jgi:hypothetical protein
MKEPTMHHVIDMSRLKRRTPDLTTVVKPRFLFPGWVIKDDNGSVVSEVDWSRLTSAVLIRKVNTIKISWDTDGRPAWVLTGRTITHNWGCRHEVLFTSDASFEDVVKATEQYLMIAHENYDTDLFRVKSETTPVKYLIDEIVNEWRHPDGF